MRIVFMGTPEAAAVSLEHLIGEADPVVGVVTQPDRPSGRGQKTIGSPVRKVAEKHGLPVAAPEKIRAPEFLELLTGWAPDLIVVVAYGRILPRSILELAPHGCLNVHYSLLPKLRGAAPVPWAIIASEEKTGVTTMRLVEKMDAGPVFLQEEVAVAADETSTSLFAKLIPVGARLLSETIQRMKTGKIEPRPQREEEATYAPIIKKEDGRIDWAMPAIEIERRVRAFTPWPSAYTQWKEKLLKVQRARVIDRKADAPPGEVILADRQNLCVATGRGVLCLEQVQLENKKSMEVSEFLKGARIEKGANL
ncbi:MAG: methionyl-tRNA formyltransferase [Candidatus Binatia bacterium]